MKHIKIIEIFSIQSSMKPNNFPSNYTSFNLSRARSIPTPFAFIAIKAAPTTGGAVINLQSA
jgi:hypothetical protein